MECCRTKLECMNCWRYMHMVQRIAYQNPEILPGAGTWRRRFYPFYAEDAALHRTSRKRGLSGDHQSLHRFSQVRVEKSAPFMHNRRRTSAACHSGFWIP